MKRSAAGRTSPRAALAVIVLVVAAAVAATLTVRFLVPDTHGRAQLPILGHVQNFDHVDENGAAFRPRQLEGKVWLASFLYTTCPGPCPILVGKLKRFAARFADRPDFAMVSFSVDPVTDTPQVLHAYTKSHGIDTSRWSFVTGSPDAVIATIRKSFYVDAAPAAQVADKPGIDTKRVERLHGPVVHSLRVVLVDRQRRIRGFYDSNDPAALEDLGRDVTRLLEAAPPADDP